MQSHPFTFLRTSNRINWVLSFPLSEDCANMFAPFLLRCMTCKKAQPSFPSFLSPFNPRTLLTWDIIGKGGGLGKGKVRVRKAPSVLVWLWLTGASFLPLLSPAALKNRIEGGKEGEREKGWRNNLFALKREGGGKWGSKYGEAKLRSSRYRQVNKTLAGKKKTGLPRWRS